ncbi:hypothetical protein DPEC_G00378130 [Dallia pectoralis]|nr:hypothetical protein DPEC_G00378130 [Dallia pectoralis]
MDSDCDYLLYSEADTDSVEDDQPCLHCSDYSIQKRPIRCTVTYNTPEVSFDRALTGCMVPYVEVYEVTHCSSGRSDCNWFGASATPLCYAKDGAVVSLQGAIHMQDVSPNGTWLSERAECRRSMSRLSLAGMMPELNRIVLEQKNDDGLLYLANKWFSGKANMNEGIELFGPFVCDAMLAPVLHKLLRFFLLTFGTLALASLLSSEIPPIKVLFGNSLVMSSRVYNHARGEPRDPQFDTFVVPVCSSAYYKEPPRQQAAVAYADSLVSPLDGSQAAPLLARAVPRPGRISGQYKSRVWTHGVVAESVRRRRSRCSRLLAQKPPLQQAALSKADSFVAPLDGSQALGFVLVSAVPWFARIVRGACWLAGQSESRMWAHGTVVESDWRCRLRFPRFRLKVY